MLKLAVSADGKVALAGRRPAPITGEAARARVHLMRAMNDAILIGIGTALADDPQLTCRLPGMAARSPVRVVLDPGLRLPVTGNLVRSARETPVWVMASESAPAEAEAALVARGVKVFRPAAFCPPPRGEGEETLRPYRTGLRATLDIVAALRLLADQGITRLMVEGGPTVAASFLAADLVDEAVLLRGPKPIGPDGIDALEAMPLTVLTDSPKLRSRGIKTVGEDTIEAFERA
jgi:diaminohydroxyphosphoribosylaminopyrimidine deaminase / 5-amino-6-(5-phosphoribosylamino)uracil reductase